MLTAHIAHRSSAQACLYYDCLGQANNVKKHNALGRQEGNQLVENNEINIISQQIELQLREHLARRQTQILATFRIVAKLLLSLSRNVIQLAKASFGLNQSFS